MVDAIEYLHKENPGSIEDETEDQTRTTMAETATATLDREIDYTLEENSEHVLGDRRRAEADRGRHLRDCVNCGSRSRRSGWLRSRGRPLHRLQAPEERG